VAHRGAIGADRTGDGAGILTCIPEKLFRREAARLSFALGEDAAFAIGTFFLPRRQDGQLWSMEIVEKRSPTKGCRISAGAPSPYGWIGWAPPQRRRAPRSSKRSSAGRRTSIPTSGSAGSTWPGVSRRGARAQELHGFCVVSLSHRTVVYKALLTGTELKAFYPDLEDPDYATSIALFHQRYSTNTVPSWASPSRSTSRA